MQTLNKSIQSRIRTSTGTLPDTYIMVTVSDQSLQFIKDGSLCRRYTISTSKFGIGNVEGSFKTPLGIHQIVEKYGAGAAKGTIFRDRIDTGLVWSPAIDNDENSIVTRILRLKGLEPGINQGAGIDSYERYIYIHGTNKEHAIGTPLSYGCVCMKSNDIIELFDLVREGTLVIISE